MGSSRAALCIWTVFLSLQAATVLLATTPPALVRLTGEPTTGIKACNAPGIGKAETEKTTVDNLKIYNTNLLQVLTFLSALKGIEKLFLCNPCMHLSCTMLDRQVQ
jgi:hypothetical protein